MSIECYFISGSPFAWRVLLALQIKRLDFKATEIYGSKGDNKTPEYLAMNPHGKVPVLTDGNTTIYESLAILAYLERKYPEKPLFGISAEESALIWQRIMEVEMLLPPIVGGMIRPVFTGSVEGNETAINVHIENLKGELARYEGWLDGQEYLAGGGLSAADVALYPVIAIITRVMGMQTNDKLDIGFLPLTSTYPALVSWMTRIESIPGFDAVYPPHWKVKKAV